MHKTQITHHIVILHLIIRDSYCNFLIFTLRSLFSYSLWPISSLIFGELTSKFNEIANLQISAKIPTKFNLKVHFFQNFLGGQTSRKLVLCSSLDAVSLFYTSVPPSPSFDNILDPSLIIWHAFNVFFISLCSSFASIKKSGSIINPLHLYTAPRTLPALSVSDMKPLRCTRAYLEFCFVKPSCL